MSDVEHFGELHSVTLLRNQTLYALPVGETRPYFKFDRLARRVAEARVSDNPVVRHTSVANKWKTIHLLLHPGYNATHIQYNLTFQREDDTEFTMTLNVTIDTREPPQVNLSQAAGKDAGTDQKPTPTPEPAFLFPDVPEDKRGPKIQRSEPGGHQTVVEVPSLNVSLLPADVQSELQKLEEKLLIGDITMKGYNLTKAELLSPYRTMAQLLTKDKDSQPANEGAVQGKQHKDLNGEQSEGKEVIDKKDVDIIQKHDDTSRKEAAVQDKPLTPLLPVHIDDEPNNETPKPRTLNAAIERPMTSRLLSHISKIKSAESRAEPADGAGAAPVGRRLQHYVSADRSFLPWERTKYFQHLLEVNTACSFTPVIVH